MATDVLDQEIREVLGRSLGATRRPIGIDPVGAVRRRVARRRRRRRVVVGTTFAALLAVGATVAIVVDRSGGSERTLDVISPPDTQPEASDTTAPHDPIDSTTDGAEIMPAPPIEARGDSAVTWTGDELVVWGGDIEASNMGLPGPDRNFVDGAAFAPTTGTWRTMSSSPLPATNERPVAELTEAGVVVARGRASALWNPDEDTWRSLDDAPADVLDLHSNGRLVMSHSANAVLDVETGRWRAMPAKPLQLERPTSVWTGHELVVIGGPDTPFTSVAAIAYNPERDEWRRLADPPQALTGEATAATWDGERIVVVNYDMRAMAYDPAMDAWEELPSVPARFYEWYPSLQSTGGRSVAFMAMAMVVLGNDGKWLPLPYGDVPFGTIATTRPAFGTQPGDGVMFVWSIDVERASNVLVAVDMERLTQRPTRLQVGVASIALADGDTLVDSSYVEDGVAAEVAVVISQADGARCTVSTRYSALPIALRIAETLQNDGLATTWFRDEAGTTWQSNATTSDVLTITCDQPDAARTTAETAGLPRL